MKFTKSKNHQLLLRSSINKFLGVCLIFIISIITLGYSIRPLANMNPLQKEGNHQAALQSRKKSVEIGLKLTEVYPTKMDLMDENISTYDIDPFTAKYLYNSNISAILISLDYIYILPEYLEAIRTGKICFQDIFVIDKSYIRSSNQVTKTQKLFEGTSPLCVGKGKTIIFGETIKYAKFLYTNYQELHIPYYYYPFDREAVNFLLYIKAYRQAKSNNLIDNSDIFISTSSSNIDQNIKVLENKLIRKGSVFEAYLKLIHPERYWLFSIAVLLCVPLLALIALIFINDGDAWQVTIGYLVGLWSLRTILIPEKVDTSTFIDDVILRLYLLLPIAIIIKYGLNYLNRMNNKNKIEPPIKVKKRNLRVSNSTTKQIWYNKPTIKKARRGQKRNVLSNRFRSF